MISITKVFRFEAAHAIYSYPGACANIHGHSYELHVSIRSESQVRDYIDHLGIIFDFKELKSLVTSVVDQLDHKILLSKSYCKNVSPSFTKDELTLLEYEPTAENLLIFFRDNIIEKLPEEVSLTYLKLWETRDSYAEWTADMRSNGEYQN